MTDPIRMSSSKPYLIRALYDWIVDNDLTPHLLVNTEIPGVQVPAEYVESGRIILNVSPSATQELKLDNEWIVFQARFSQKTVRILVPVVAVLAVYARENGRGMVFDAQAEEDNHPPTTPPPDGHPPLKQKPNLVVVK